MDRTNTREIVVEDIDYLARTLEAIVRMCDDCRKGKIAEAKTTNPGMLGLLDVVVEQGQAALKRAVS